MKKSNNKKLLFLGTSVASVNMIKYAQEQGAYVIVTDNLSVEQSEAKRYADKIENISTMDEEALFTYAQEHKIDAILCGISERNLVMVQKLCDRLSLPCYFNTNQWNLCQNKDEFKSLCIQEGVPVPRKYLVSDKNIKYPVIVKPVDGFAAVGVSICYNRNELIKGYEHAQKMSKSNTAIIEQYLIGTEITAVYTIKDGKISLSMVRDRYPSQDHEGVTAQFDACFGPSIHYSNFMKTANEPLKRLLKRINLKVGTAFFQGIVVDNTAYIFECGLRMNAVCDFYNIEEANNINYMKMLVDYSLGLDLSQHDIKRDKPYPNKYCCIFNMSVHAGIIGTMEGIEKCKEIPNVIFAEFLLNCGAIVEDNNSMAQSVFRAYLNDECPEKIKESIHLMQKYIKVNDIYGNNMLFKEFDTKRLKFAELYGEMKL